MNIPSLLHKSFRDYFSLKILFITSLPLLLGLVFWGSILYFYGESITHSLLAFLPQWLINEQADGQNGAFHLIFSWLISCFIYGIFLCLILISNILLTPFYSPFIIACIHARSFTHIPRQSFGTLLGHLSYFLQLASLIGGLLIFCIPLYFVPFLGAFIFFTLGFIFFKQTMFYDIGSSLMSKEQFAHFQQATRIKNYTIAFIAYIWSFIPIINFFVMPLQILILTHYFLAYLDSGQKKAKPL